MHANTTVHTLSPQWSASASLHPPPNPTLLLPPEETLVASLFTSWVVHNLLSAETNWQDKTHSCTNAKKRLHCALITRPAEMHFDPRTLFDQWWTGGNDGLGRGWPFDVRFSPQAAWEHTMTWLMKHRLENHVKVSQIKTHFRATAMVVSYFTSAQSPRPVCKNRRTSGMPDLLLISLTLVKLLQPFRKTPPLYVKEQTHPSQLALHLPSCLCLRFIATLYLLCLSGRLKLRRSWPPSSSAVCQGGISRYLYSTEISRLMSVSGSITINLIWLSR